MVQLVHAIADLFNNPEYYGCWHSAKAYETGMWCDVIMILRFLKSVIEQYFMINYIVYKKKDEKFTEKKLAKYNSLFSLSELNIAFDKIFNPTIDERIKMCPSNSIHFIRLGKLNSDVCKALFMIMGSCSNAYVVFGLNSGEKVTTLHTMWCDFKSVINKKLSTILHGKGMATTASEKSCIKAIKPRITEVTHLEYCTSSNMTIEGCFKPQGVMIPAFVDQFTAGVPREFLELLINSTLCKDSDNYGIL